MHYSDWELAFLAEAEWMVCQLGEVLDRVGLFLQALAVDHQAAAWVVPEHLAERELLEVGP